MNQQDHQDQSQGYVGSSRGAWEREEGRWYETPSGFFLLLGVLFILSWFVKCSVSYYVQQPEQQETGESEGTSSVP